MATGEQVPWTDPGGTPCCCEEPDNCLSSLVSNLGVSISNFLRIDLTNDQYASLKNGTTLDFSATLTVFGTGPNGAITSYFPDPLTIGTTISFVNCFGQGANNIGGLAGINAFPLLVLVTSGGIQFTYGADYNFAIILQAAGQGAAGDAPLSSPAMYLYGTIARVNRTLPTREVVFTISSSGSSVGTLFGQSIKATKTVTGGTDGTLSVTMDFSAP